MGGPGRHYGDAGLTFGGVVGRATTVLAMPFDLVRHDLLTDLKPLEPARIRSIVDELFLPLVPSGSQRTDDAGMARS